MMKLSFGVFILCSTVLIQRAECQVSFAPIDTVYYSTSYQYSSFKLGNVYPVDLNSDGLDDMVYLKGTSIFSRLNLGDGQLGDEHLMYTDNKHIYSISNFADVNNDTHPDLAIGTVEAIKLLVGGDNKFTKISQSNQLLYYGRLILLDFDKDGKLDLTSTGSVGISLYKDVAQGFNQSTNIYNDSESPVYDYHIQDLNKDSQWDLVVTHFATKFKVQLGTSTGIFTDTFSATVTNNVLFETGDINLDGFIDVMYLDQGKDVFLLTYNNANNSFTSNSVFGGSGLENMNDFELIDWKGNGTLDIVYNRYFSLVVRENTGTGSFLPERILSDSEMMPQIFHECKLDSDNLKDLVFADYNKFQVVKFDASGTIKHKITEGYFSDYWSVLFEDVDKDGYKDLVHVSRTGKLEIRWGDPSYSYLAQSSFPIPIDSFYGAVADIDTDGHLDLLVTQQTQNNSLNQVVALKGKGGRQFHNFAPWKYMPYPSKPFIIDIDKDGRNEYVSFANFDNRVFVLDFDNPSFDEALFEGGSFVVDGSGITAMTCADINNDSYPDIITANSFNKSVTILVNNKVGGFTNSLLGVLGAVEAVHGVGTMDVDNDSDLDLFVMVETSPNVNVANVFINSGGSFSPGFSLNLDNIYLPRNFDVFDIDGDNDLDFVISAWDYSGTNVFIRNGSEFTRTDSPIKSIGQSARIYGDLNNDGRIDVYSATFNIGARYFQLNNSVLEPTSVETVISISGISENSAEIVLSPSESNGRLVVLTKGGSLSTSPTDNMFYAANTQYGIGSKLSDNSYVLHFGKDESLNVTGLTSSTSYLVSVFDYNTNAPQMNIVNYTNSKVEKIFTTLNIPPTIEPIADQSGMNLEKIDVVVTATDSDNSFEDLLFQAASSNTLVIPNNNLLVSKVNNAGKIQIEPIAEGESEITVTVTDPAGNSATAKFLYVSVIVGLKENGEKALSVFPIPAKNWIDISHKNHQQQLMIFNARGQLVGHYVEVPRSLNLSDFNDGLYLLVTTDGSIKKIIKK